MSENESTNWLIPYWCEKDIRGLIKMPFSRHWIMHIEAMRRIKNRLCKLARKGVDPIGYIKETALPAEVAVANLKFSYAPVTITQETELTDDPIGEKTSLHVLPVGTEAEWLATMDDWAYLKWKGGSQPVRGFVPASVVCLKSAE